MALGFTIRYFTLILCGIQLYHSNFCLGFDCGKPKISLICTEKQLTTFPSPKCSSPYTTHYNRTTHCLILSRNRLEKITQAMFSTLKGLETLRLNKNRLSTIESGAFDNLTSLRDLDLSENFLTHITTSMFSRLKHLNKLHLDGNAIISIQPGSFDRLNVLYHIKLQKNKINALPQYNRSTSAVTTLNLAYNPISFLTRSTMKSYPDLINLFLKNTELRRLPPLIFEHNTQLRKLDLSNTPLDHIDGDAFSGVELRDLYLQGTLITRLPEKGMEYLYKLNIVNTKHLWSLPFTSFKHLEYAKVEYPFHCCLLTQSLNDNHDPSFYNFTTVKKCPTPSYETITTALPTPTTQRITTTQRIIDIFHKHKKNYKEYKNISVTFAPNKCVDARKPIYDKSQRTPPPFVCLPQPDAFNPCEDLLGTVGLRVCTWIVLVFAIIGNGMQLIVLLTSKRNNTMYQVLLCNLSVANLFMGIYLSMLAATDAQSYGRYQNHAMAWQYGPGCNIAGFLSILSTELAAYTLTVITVERYFTIVHPLKQHMHLSTKQVIGMILVGWFISLTLAALPLTGVSSYQKVAICLPFEVGNKKSKAYVTFLLVTNGLAFVIVLFCYARMFLSLGGSTCSSATRIESRVARKMAMLVLSNFACWFPVALFSFIAIYGSPVIDVPTSKFLLVFIYPINAFTNPYLYALGTKHFQLDLLDLLRNFSFCENTIDKLRGRILQQLASLPHTTNSRAFMGSRTSVNSYRPSPAQSTINSPSLGSPTNTTKGSFSLRFLSIPKINLRSRNDDDYDMKSALGCSNSSITNDPPSEQYIPYRSHDQPLLKDAKNGDDHDDSHLDIFRRLSAREVIIGGKAIKNKFQNSGRHLDHLKASEDLNNQNKLLLNKDLEDSSKTLPVVMVTTC